MNLVSAGPLGHRSRRAAFRASSGSRRVATEAPLGWDVGTRSRRGRDLLAAAPTTPARSPGDRARRRRVPRGRGAAGAEPSAAWTRRARTDTAVRPRTSRCSVVGGGPAGLFAAAELARHGVRARVIERAAEPHRQARATAIQPGTLEILAQVGLLDDFVAASVQLPFARLFDAQLEALGEMTFADAGCEWGFQCSLPQWRTERILSERLAELGVEVEHGVDALSAPDARGRGRRTARTRRRNAGDDHRGLGARRRRRAQRHSRRDERGTGRRDHPWAFAGGGRARTLRAAARRRSADRHPGRLRDARATAGRSLDLLRRRFRRARRTAARG